MIEARFHLARGGGFTLDAAFALPAQGVSALFGPSGCGKTTLLRCIAGLTPRAVGHLRIGEETWQDTDRGVFVPPHKRGVGFVFQHTALFPHMNVDANVRFAFTRRPEEAGGPTLEDVIERTGIGHLLGRAPASLSGGERQRVAIARALASAPRLLLLDEPVSALDLDTRQVFLPYLQSLCHSLSVPVIYVSHSVQEVALIADRVCLMERGRIGETVSPGALESRAKA